ncbi:MET3 [Symbiodinium microadriaticum]|nr:MET3 [Symbiodinium microadriaticum]
MLRLILSVFVSAALAQDATCDAATGRCKSAPGEPHGGSLVDLNLADAAAAKLVAGATATLELSQRQACDVSLLINGGFSPLTGFMKQADYNSVVEGMRLTSGHLFGLPVILDVPDESLRGKTVLLTYQGAKLAVFEAEEVWKPDKVKEAKASYGTTSTEHPSVAELFADLGKFYAGGKLHGLGAGFETVWGKGFRTPKEVRASLPAGKQVVAFQNRNPVHKAHFELLVHANKDVENSIVLVHPTCGPTQPGDIDGPTRIKTYEVLQEEPEYKKWAGESFRWSYLPYSMKMAGPREAIQHMIIRKNFGATHFIIGRDMAGTKSTLTSEDFYGAYEAQDMGKKHSEELSVKVVDYPNMVYVGQEHGNERGYATDVEAKAKGVKINKLSGTEFRKRLRSGEEIPEWFAFPKVVKVLREGGDKIFLWSFRVLLIYFVQQPAEAPNGADGQEQRQNSSWLAGQEGEVCGARLRSVLHSVEGLARLLFSTVLLCWNIRRVLPDSEGGNNTRLSFQEWLEVNSRIEADGTTPSVAVQKCIYNTLLQDECIELLPDASVKKTAMPEFQEAPEDTSSALRAAGQVAGETLSGWASIPPGGLERFDVPMPHGHQGGLSGAKLSHCVLSETSSSFLDRGHKNGINLLQPEVTASSGEAVWMSLKYAFWLFFSTSPDDPAPYVFIRLQDTVLRETNLRDKSLVLAGRMKKSADDDVAGPFGDSAREPLRLCFLLADGRFQLFEALWLELQLTSEEAFTALVRCELSGFCRCLFGSYAWRQQSEGELSPWHEAKVQGKMRRTSQRTLEDHTSEPQSPTTLQSCGATRMGNGAASAAKAKALAGASSDPSKGVSSASTSSQAEVPAAADHPVEVGHIGNVATFPSEASGTSVDGPATMRRREKRSRISAVPEQAGQSTELSEALKTPVLGRRASQTVKPEMLDPQLEEFLTKAFQKHFLLKSVPEVECKALSLSMKVKHAVPEEVVVRQGEIVESVYFIRYGSFQMMQDNACLSNVLGPGDSFGELALLYSIPSSTTIVATENGELWKMERQRFLECKEQLSSSQIEKAMEFFQACQDFRYLKEDDQKSLAAVCTSKTFEDGSIVLQDEEVGECMLIVISGQVAAAESTADAFDRVSYGKPGSVIGSVGVLYHKQQAKSFAKGPVECLCLNKAALSGFSPSVLDVLRRAAFKAILHSLPRNPLDPEPWRILSEQQVNLLISRTEDGTFEPGEIIFAPQDGAQLIVVISGQVAIMKGLAKTREEDELVFAGEDVDILQQSDKVIEAGHCYGKQPEFLEGVSMSTFGIAVGKVRLHRILHSNVQELLGDSLMEVMRCAEIKRVLSDIFLFKNLNEEQIDRTVRELEQQIFAAGEIIVQQDDPARHFYLIQRGTVVVRKDGKVLRTLGRWDYFGERGLLLQERRSATCQALDECICLVLDADEFFQIVGHFKDELERRMQLQDLNLSISDLQCTAVVGRGTFGVVRLVTPKGKKDAPEYALKCVKKAQVVKGHQQKAIIMEREVNAQCYHPCIVQFIKTFQDKYNVYFLTEFLGGGDLFYAIRAIGALTKVQSQFFTGSIALGIEYLHGRGIMYRDLKPENVLLDFAGRAKLVDFGCCKKEIRANTLVGTPEYLAPEVIKGKGYTKSIDWWSLGVMLYEFVVGPIPFGAGEEDQMRLFAAISEAPLTFPTYVAEDAMQVLSGLLERRPERRLGSSGAKEIKKHLWFKGFDWDALAGGFFPPPWQPDAQAQMRNWEEPDGDLMDHVSTESFSFAKGMEWAKLF